ncbi:unnamed protein product, partial [marine sediment metagenome]
CGYVDVLLGLLAADPDLRVAFLLRTMRQRLAAIEQRLPAMDFGETLGGSEDVDVSKVNLFAPNAQG